jgi:GNAT superfamily N-acetyltransferase
MDQSTKIEIAWCVDPDEAPMLGQFFADHVTPAYISHSELQGPRAIDAGHWQPDLPILIAREINERVRDRDAVSAARDTKPVLVARVAGEVVGLGMVSFSPTAPEPYAIVEDLVVDQNRRGLGIGRYILDWVTDQVRSAGCKRLFLESGRQNHRAHEFFKREGFSTCSVVMMKPVLPAGAPVNASNKYLGRSP